MTKHPIGAVAILALLAAAPAPAQDTPTQPPAEESVIHLGAVERVTIHPKEKRIEVPGEIVLQKGAIEVMACARGGKVHESVLVLRCRPSDLNAALLYVGCKATAGPSFLGDPTKPEGTRLVVEVGWDADGKAARHRLEDLAYDLVAQAPMPRIAWVYAGSKFVQDPASGTEVYMADRERNLITTWHDPHALLDNPLPTGGDDTVYVAHTERLPARGTGVRVTIRLATEAEIAESRTCEAEAERVAAVRAAEAKAAREKEAREQGGGEGGK